MSDEMSDSRIMETETMPFRISAATWALRMGRYRPVASTANGVFFLAMVGVSLGVLVDLRWMIAAMMVLLIVAPMALAMLFIYYGMLPLNSVNLTRHTISLSPQGLRVVARPRTESKEEAVENGEENTETEEIPEREYHVEKVEDWGYAPDGLWIDVEWRGKRCTLFIPAKCFRTPDDFRTATNCLTYLKKHQ